MQGIAAILLRFLGLGAILTTVSEIWFYPVVLWGVDGNVFGLTLYYGLFAYVGWLLCVRLRITSWVGAFAAACLMGFFIEGIPVPVVYEAIPFTIFWTSISWHALISAALGVWGFRVLFARAGRSMQILCCLLAGLYLGAWSVELWSLREFAGPEWVWTPVEPVAFQMAVGWLVFIAGHWALDLAARFTLRPAAWELPVFGFATAGLFAAGYLIALFPISLILPVLSALFIWVIARDGTTEGELSPWMVRLSNLRVGFEGYLISGLVPVVAILVYAMLARFDVQLEAAAIHIIWAGPVSIVLVVLAFWRSVRR